MKRINELFVRNKLKLFGIIEHLFRKKPVWRNLKVENMHHSFKLTLCISFGLLLNQFFHTLAYWQSGAHHVAGFPNLQIPIYLAFIFSGLIFIISMAIFLTLFEKIRANPHQIIYLAVILEIISQVFSRGLMKTGFDCLLMVIGYANLLIGKIYASNDIFNLDSRVLTLIHTELSSLLRISVGIVIFIWSAIGIAFAVQFLQRYYENPLRFHVMVWYGVMVIYLGLCFGLFISYTLFNRMVTVRNIYKDNIQ